MMTEALLLAAGFSTRLRPLTHDVPKILLPFLHLKMLDLQMAFLKHHGIGSFGINVHHGRASLINALSKVKTFNIEPFNESPHILGSGGGLFNMKTFGNSEDILVMNSDILCDIDIQKAYAFHKNNKALATLILVSANENKYGSVGIDFEGKISKLRTQQSSCGIRNSGVFSGVQIIHRSLFDHDVPKGEFDLIEKVYIPLMNAKAALFAYLDDSFWLDIGEIKSYLSSQFSFLKENPTWAKALLDDFRRSSEDVWIHNTAIVPAQTKITGPVFIGPNCVINKTATLGPATLLTSDITVGENCNLQNTLIYPGQSLASNTTHENAIVANHLFCAIPKY